LDKSRAKVKAVQGRGKRKNLKAKYIFCIKASRDKAREARVGQPLPRQWKQGLNDKVKITKIETA
jgi:hypothetical protein